MKQITNDSILRSRIKNLRSDSPSAKHINAENVRKALASCRLVLLSVCSESYYSSGAYKCICEYLGIKDSSKNRRRVQRVLLRERAVEAAMMPQNAIVAGAAPMNRVLRIDPAVDGMDEGERKKRVGLEDNRQPKTTKKKRIESPKESDEETNVSDQKSAEENGREEQKSEGTTDTPREETADYDYLQFLEDREFPTSEQYKDEWVFYTDVESATAARGSTEMIIGMETTENTFRLVNLSPSSLFDASNLLSPHFYEILTDGENLKLHLLMEVPTDEVSDDRLLPKLLKYTKSVVSTLLGSNFGVNISDEDFLVLSVPRSTSKLEEYRLILPKVVFKNMTSLAHFCAMVNKEVEDSSEGEVNAYYLRVERPAVYLRDTALCLFSKELGSYKETDIYEINDKNAFYPEMLEMSLITLPSIRTAEAALNFESKASICDELVYKSFRTERIVAAFETLGEVLTLHPVPADVYLWFIERLGRRYNIRKIQVLPYEEVINIYFEGLICRTSEVVMKHESYVQLHAKFSVAYFLCDNLNCRQQLKVEDDRCLVRKIDFIIPLTFQGHVAVIVKESTSKCSYLDTEQAAVSDDYLVIEEIKEPGTDLFLYSEMQKRLKEERVWRDCYERHSQKSDGVIDVTGGEESRTQCPKSPVGLPHTPEVGESAEESMASSQNETAPASSKGNAIYDKAEDRSEADSVGNNSEAENGFDPNNCGTEEDCAENSGDSDLEEVLHKRERKSYYCPKKGKNQYCEIGTVELTTEQWDTVWNEERNELRKRHFMATVAGAFNTLKVFCVINLNRSRVTPRRDGCKIDLYCYCAFKECRNFIITINHTKSVATTVDRERTECFMTVRMCSCDMKHGAQGYRTRHCSGVDRLRMKEELRFKKPSAFRLDKLRCEDRDFLKNGNTLDVKSSSVNRKIRSEDKKKVDMHDDPLFDVLLRMRRQLKAEELKEKEKDKKEKQKATPAGGEEEKSKVENSSICTHDDGDVSCKHKDEEKLDNHQFIQTVGQPFSIITHCSHRALVFDLAKKFFKAKSSKEVLTLHLDSTGSIVDNIPACNKTIYLYSLVINVKNVILSLSDYYTSEHNIESIQGWLNRTNRFYNEGSHKPLAPHVVTDKSAALIASACLALNKMSFDVYLNTCYRIVAEDASRKEMEATKGRLSILHLCVAHLAKSFATTLFRSYSYSSKIVDSKLSKEEHKELRAFLMSGLMLIPHLESYDSIKEVLRCIFILLLTPYENEMVDEASKKLIEFKLTGEDFQADEVEHDERSELEEEEDKLRIDMLLGDVTYKKIGFYKDMLTIYEEIEKSQKNNEGNKEKEKKRNIYVNKKLAKFFLVNYTYMLPLWSGLLSPSGITFSNANVEKWFDTFKNVILDGAGAQRINRVLDCAERHVIGKSVELDLDIPKEGLTGRKRKEKKQKQDADDVVSDPDDPESIDRSPKKTECSEETGDDLKESRYSESKKSARSEGSEVKLTMNRSDPFESNSVCSPDKDEGKDAGQDSDETEKPIDSFEGAKDEVLDAFDPNVEEYWNSKPRKRKSTYSAVFLRNWAAQKERRSLRTNEIKINSAKRKSSRESIEYAKRRRSSLFDRSKEEFTYEDFILDFLNPDTLVIQNYSYYSALQNDTFKGKLQDDISTCYPITKHKLLLKSYPNKKNERHDCTNYLYARDFCALETFDENVEDTDSLWITSDIIDSAVSIFVRDVYSVFGRTVSVFPCHLARKVVVGRFMPDDIRLNKVDEHVNWVILPYNPSNHWIVIIVDAQRMKIGGKRRFWYLDPMGQNTVYRKPSFRKILSDLSTVCPFVERDDLLEEKKIVLPSQNGKTYSRPDTWNCGIYSLFYIESFIRQADSDHFHVSSHFNPDEYRIYISGLLLHHSLTMRDTCKTCGQTGPEGMKWVQCDYCCRWAHLSEECIDDENVNWTELNRNSDSVEFLCKLCGENQKEFSAAKASKIAYYNDIYKCYSSDTNGLYFLGSNE